MIWILCIITLLFSGCQQKAQERHYTEVVMDAPVQTVVEPVKSDMNADPHAGMDMTSMDMTDMEMPTVMNTLYSWIAPEGWKQEPGQGFRLASFHLREDKEAIDCSVISLAGPAGGLGANLKRWMGQIALEATASDLTALISSATTIKIKGGQEGKVFDFTTIQSKADPSVKSMVVVMLSMKEATLFVKMTGTKANVNINKNDFFKFVQTIEPKGNSQDPSADPHMGLDLKDPHAGMDMNDPHAGMDMASMGAMMGSTTPSESILAWVVPEGWKEEAASPMRLATFHALSDPASIDCSIISLGGIAGGVEGNLTRWLGQLSLSSSPEILKDLMNGATVVKSKDGLQIKVYDFASIQSQAKATDKSMIAAMISMEQATIFIKMTGSLESVKQNKDEYLKLLSSIARK